MAKKRAKKRAKARVSKELTVWKRLPYESELDFRERLAFRAPKEVYDEYLRSIGVRNPAQNPVPGTHRRQYGTLMASAKAFRKKDPLLAAEAAATAAQEAQHLNDDDLFYKAENLLFELRDEADKEARSVAAEQQGAKVYVYAPNAAMLAKKISTDKHGGFRVKAGSNFLLFRTDDFGEAVRFLQWIRNYLPPSQKLIGLDAKIVAHVARPKKSKKVKAVPKTNTRRTPALRSLMRGT